MAKSNAKPNDQLSFAEIGTIFNQISNQLGGGVSNQNQNLLLKEVESVQSQLQQLIDSGSFDTYGGLTITHAQNVADQMNFLSSVIESFGTNGFEPKYINDVVRDVQDIVQGDENLAALSQEDGLSGFQMVSYLLAPPAPYPDSDLQTQTLNQFIEDSNSFAAQANALAGSDPNSPEVQQLISDIQAFSVAADAYSTAQGDVFSARFNNEFNLDGVQGTAVREIVNGLLTQNVDLVNGAAEVLTQNAQDVAGNMLTMPGYVPVPNGGIPDVVDTVYLAGSVFNDAVTKLIGGVYGASVAPNGTTIPGNQQSILNDLAAVKDGLLSAVDTQDITGKDLKTINKIVDLLDKESALVSAVDTPQQVSSDAMMINKIQTKIIGLVNDSDTLHTLALDAPDGAAQGFAPLPPTGNGNAPVYVAQVNGGAPASSDVATVADDSAAQHHNVDHGWIHG